MDLFIIGKIESILNEYSYFFLKNKSYVGKYGEKGDKIFEFFDINFFFLLMFFDMKGV